jgi:hypothetical protein
MSLKIQYLRDDLPGAECWAFYPLTACVEEATDMARDALIGAHEYFGATSFRITDGAGDIVAEHLIGADGVTSPLAGHVM